jgi:hypothetical protein
MDPPQATATIFVCPEFRELANSWVTKEQNLLVEAPDPHGRIPISTPNTYKVAENIHMHVVSRWIHHQATTTILVG